MGTNTTESECEKCGGVSWFMVDSEYDLTEEHCLNEKCRYYFVDAGTLKEENPDAVDGSGIGTPEGWLDALEVAGYKKCEKCGKVESNQNDHSPLCEECEDKELNK